MFERLLGIILPVFMVIALGYVYARRAKPDLAWVNRINLNVLAPALIFSALASKDFDLAANRALILGAVGVVAGSGLPPAVFNVMVAEQYDQEPARVASIVLIGNVASPVFVPLGLSLALR